MTDISLSKQYAGLCGITDTELKQYFEKEIADLAGEQELLREECLTELKKTYYGYRFHPDGVRVYGSKIH